MYASQNKRAYSVTTSKTNIYSRGIKPFLLPSWWSWILGWSNIIDYELGGGHCQVTPIVLRDVLKGNSSAWYLNNLIGYKRGGGCCQVIPIALRDAIRGNTLAFYFNCWIGYERGDGLCQLVPISPRDVLMGNNSA